ncbi:MAG: DUF1153 domain-containing protein [Xanthobacteraceae bacterium]
MLLRARGWRQWVERTHVRVRALEGRSSDGLPGPVDRRRSANSSTKRWTVRRKADVVASVRGGLVSLDKPCRRYALDKKDALSWQCSIPGSEPNLCSLGIIPSVESRSSDMGMISNARAKNETSFVPSLIAKQQREPARDADERSQVENRSEVPTRASPTPDGAQRLKEMLAGMTWEPRAAINDIEQEIGLLRDRIAEREQVLVEAIDQHANLSKEAVRGMGVVRQAVAQIRDAFNVAMRPIPILDDQAGATNPGSDDRRA